MRTVIAGSRTATQADVDEALELCPWADQVTVVISGSAQGADRAGERWAEKHDIPVESHPADWDLHGRSAGYVRNQEMINVADAVVAVWDGESRGTAHTIGLAEKADLYLHVHHFKE